MPSAHVINIGVHVLSGLIAMLLGFSIVFMAKGTARHKRFGRWFFYATLVVCMAAALGLFAFRFLPVFAVLTVLVWYQLLGGWRAAQTQGAGPNALDAFLTVLATGFTVWLTPIVIEQTTGAKALVYSTLAAVASMLFYDSVRWLFPRRWYARLWLYEHSYKMLAALFGMLSALVGNVVRYGQPWSQLLPSALGLAVIVFFFWRISRGEGQILSVPDAMRGQ